MIAVAEAALCVVMLVDFKTGNAGFQFVTNQPWISEFGISWHLGVDGISLFLVVMTAAPVPDQPGRPGHPRPAPAFMAWMLLLEAGCIGTFLALDLFLFFLMFEVTLVPDVLHHLRLGIRRTGVYAALKFFIYTMAGSAFLLVGDPVAGPAHGGTATRRSTSSNWPG